MSDLKAAGNAAKMSLDRLDAVGKLALAGTHEHWQFMSAALMMEWPRIQFCLRMLEKHAEKSAA